MARSRNIKPSLFKNEILGTEDPLLTLLFCSLWCLADREGRLEDRPLRIKAETFPYREGIDINRYLTELYRLGFIHRYRHGNLSVIQIVNFGKHQNPHKTERDSSLPEYAEKSDSCPLTVKDTLSNGEITESAGLIPDSLNTDSLLLIPEQSPPSGSSVTKWSALTCALPVTINPTAWSAWCKYKSESKKPIKQTTAKLQWEFLAAYPHDVQLEIVEQSIRSGWQGLFEPKKRIESATEFIDRHTDTSWRDELNNTPSIPAIEFYGDKKTGG